MFGQNELFTQAKYGLFLKEQMACMEKPVQKLDALSFSVLDCQWAIATASIFIVYYNS